MRVFKTDDCEWWVGETMEACQAAASYAHGYDEEDLENAEELTEEDLDEGRFYDDGVVRSFREELALQLKAGGKFPRLFACTEY